MMVWLVTYCQDCSCSDQFDDFSVNTFHWRHHHWRSCWKMNHRGCKAFFGVVMVCAHFWKCNDQTL